MKARDASARTTGRQGEEPAWTAAELWREARQLPNLLSIGRLGAVPLFVWAYVTDRPALALALFASAAVTDYLDGLLARAMGLRTRLGGILDPLADKILTLAALVALVADGRLPLWLLAAVLFRDAGMGLGVAVLRRHRVEIPAAPSRLGKYATFLLSLTVVLALLRELESAPRIDGWIAVSGILSLQCIAATVVQYSLRWHHLMLSAKR